MDKERNAHQIVRKDGKGCFVESLNDAFSIDRCHLAFAAYDLNRPTGERQTNLVQIYLDCGELLELCRKAESGELLLRLQDKKQKGDKTPLYQAGAGARNRRKRQLQQRSRQKGTATQERWLFPFSCKRKVTAKKDGGKTPRESSPHWTP